MDSYLQRTKLMSKGGTEWRRKIAPSEGRLRREGRPICRRGYDVLKPFPQSTQMAEQEQAIGTVLSKENILRLVDENSP